MPDAVKPEGDSSSDSPKFLTLDDAKSLITETVNRALTSHLGRALSPTKLKTAVREVMAERAVEQEQERSDSDTPDAGRKDGEGEGSGDAPSGKPPETEPARRAPTRPATPATSARKPPEEETQRQSPRSDGPSEGAAVAEVEGLKKKIAELEGNWRKAQKQAEQERQRAIEQKGYGDLRTVLGTKVRPDAVSVVTDVLRSRGMVVFDDDGQVRLKIRASLAKGEPEEDHVLDIESGVAHFLSTKEGALFVPPPSPGAGAAASRRPTREVPAPRPAPSPLVRSTGDKLTDLEERTGRSVEDLL